MIRHLFKLVWNRRRNNGLIMVELFMSFLVLCVVLVIACNYLNNWRQPLGFEYANVWHLDLDMGNLALGEDPRLDETWQQSEQFELMLRDLEEIETASPLDCNIPFTRSRWAYINYHDGERIRVDYVQTSPRLPVVLGLELLAGRWLEPGDEELNWEPCVLTRNYAQTMFGDENPLGQTLPEYTRNGEPAEKDEGAEEVRIVGVVENYRRYGELEPSPCCDFRMHRRDGRPPRDYLIKLQPGITAEFEENLLRTVQAVCPGWTVVSTPLERHRRDLLRGALFPLLGFSIIAGFLVLMVGMGLMGVLWLSVIRRTEELGVRRALGASSSTVQWQILGELLALTVLAISFGIVLYLQAPILQLFGAVPWLAYLVALFLALIGIGLFVMLCGLYPSWLATRVQPAEALQYE